MPLDDADIAKITTLFTTNLEGALKPLLGRLDKVEKVEPPDVAAIVAKALKDAKGDDDDANKGKGKGDAEAQARMAALEGKLAEEKTARESADKARASEKMLSALRTTLIARGVPAARVAHAVAVLHHSEGRISLDEAGAPVLRFDRTGPAGSYTDTLGLDKGLEEWLGTDDGKSFLPAAKVSGVDHHRAGPDYVTTGADGKPKVNAQNLISKVLNRATTG